MVGQSLCPGIARNRLFADLQFWSGGNRSGQSADTFRCDHDFWVCIFRGERELSATGPASHRRHGVQWAYTLGIP